MPSASPLPDASRLVKACRHQKSTVWAEDGLDDAVAMALQDPDETSARDLPERSCPIRARGHEPRTSAKCDARYLAAHAKRFDWLPLERPETHLPVPSARRDQVQCCADCQRADRSPMRERSTQLAVTCSPNAGGSVIACRHCY